MEAKLYALPKLDVEPYRTKIGSAIAEIHARYEDLGLEVDSYSPSFDRSKAVGYCLDGDILVLFKIIDNERLVNESKIETFAGIEYVSGKKFTVFLQKALLQMAFEKIVAVIQLKLDEILFILWGYSLRKARDLAMQAYKEHPPSVRIDRASNKHPGNKKLKELILKHNGNVEKIANDPEVRVTKGTVSAWINNVPELQKLAQQQRNKREEQKLSPRKRGEGQEKPRRGGRRKKTKPISNPGKEILEALIMNYEGDLKAMAENPNINTDLKTLQFWIAEEGLYELVEQQKRKG